MGDALIPAAGTRARRRERGAKARLVVAGALLAAASLGAVAPRALAAAPTGKTGCRTVDNVRVIVRATDSSTARAAIASVGGKADRNMPLLASAAGSIPPSGYSALMSAPGVVSVSADSDVAFQGTLGDAGMARPATAAFAATAGAPSLWAQGLDGSQVGVAVIDTGIAPVPGLAGRLVGGVDLTGGDDPYHDGFGHGTFVAGLIAGSASPDGSFSGMAPKARLISVKVGSDDGSADVSQILAAIQWVVSFKDQLGIRVVNLSLGTDSTQSAAHSLLNYAVERAWDAGLVVVTSASNLGPAPGTVTKPGDDPLVITVGAVDDQGTATRADDVMAAFSGEGPTVDGLAKPDLVAAGRSVVSLRAPGSLVDTQFPEGRVDDTYFRGSGTSFATAVTSGAIALMLQAQPQSTPDDVKGRLLGSAAPGPAGDANVDGRGALDVAAAVAGPTVPFNQKPILRSKGDGSLDADRGHASPIVALAPGPGCGAAMASSAAALRGDLTAQANLFNRAGFVGAPWSSSSWYSSSWYSSSWYSSSWYSSSWYSSSWYSSSWYSSSWYAAAWS